MLKVHGRPVNPGAIKRTALLTVEGERDDICGLGQTLAAQELCMGLRQHMKAHYVQTGVGHCGVFGGRRWNNTMARDDEMARRLMTIPGLGPVTASAMAASVQDISDFSGPREPTAFIGLTPKPRPATRSGWAASRRWVIDIC
jgi:polyhydroxyalkanoate depolymerase